MNRLGKALVGALVGGALGLAVPVAIALLYMALGGSAEGAGAFSFFPIVTIPLGLYVGAVAGSLWGEKKSLLDVLLIVVLGPFRSWR